MKFTISHEDAMYEIFKRAFDASTPEPDIGRDPFETLERVEFENWPKCDGWVYVYRHKGRNLNLGLLKDDWGLWSISVSELHKYYDLELHHSWGKIYESYEELLEGIEGVEVIKGVD
jgi:hypothetical protein